MKLNFTVLFCLLGLIGRGQTTLRINIYLIYALFLNIPLFRQIPLFLPCQGSTDRAGQATKPPIFGTINVKVVPEIFKKHEKQ